MVHELEILTTLAGGLTAALLLGLVTQRLRLSPIVGYLLAGIAVGPFTPGFVARGEIAQQFSELGVVLLMFGVGLQFHLEELLAVRRVVVPGALVQVAVSTAAGLLVAHLAGWGLGAGLVFGLALAIASTVVAIRMLSDADLLQRPAGSAALGWLVFEDLLTMLALVLLPILAGSGAGQGPLETALTVGLALLKVAALVVFTLVGGRRLIPVLLRFVAGLQSRELFTLCVLVLALGIAIASASLFGVSMALGAFLAGAVVGQSEFAARAASDALPMRDAFAVLFFVAMGMLLDPAQLVANAPLTLGALAVVLLVTPLCTFLLSRLTGAPQATARTLAVSLAQIGEFSFVLAAMGRQAGLLPERATQALVAASIVSITLNPLLFRLLVPRAESAAPRGLEHHRALVVGYGPVGRTLALLLRESGVEPTIIERSGQTVERLLRGGWSAVQGDAADPAVLERAGVATATGLVFTASGEAGPVIRAARQQNAALLVLARTTYLKHTAALEQAGASEAVSAEGAVALALVERVLERLGATPDQLDRARDRARSELKRGES